MIPCIPTKQNKELKSITKGAIPNQQLISFLSFACFKDGWTMNWRNTMLMVSHSLMELVNHSNTSGHLWQLFMKLVLTIISLALAVILMHRGLMKCQSLCVMTISVTRATLDQTALTVTLCLQTILYGMVRGVVPPAPAVNSTTLHGSAPHCQNPQLMILTHTHTHPPKSFRQVTTTLFSSLEHLSLSK